MSELRIFQEKNYYFGIFSDDYDIADNLNEYSISFDNALNYIWNFSKEGDSENRGHIFNLGYLIGETSNHFNRENQLFLIKDGEGSFAVKLENLVSATKINKSNTVFADNQGELESVNFTLNMLLPKIIVEKGKKVFIVEPRRIRESLRLIL